MRLVCRTTPLKHGIWLKTDSRDPIRPLPMYRFLCNIPFSPVKRDEINRAGEVVNQRLMESGLKIYEGTAKQAFGTYEMILNLGVTFPVGKIVN